MNKLTRSFSESLLKGTAGSSNGGGSGHFNVQQRHNKPQPRDSERLMKQRILILRLLLSVSLVTAVAVCATIAYIQLSKTELRVGKHTYDSIASSALLGAKAITLRKVQGSEVMATLLGHILPDSNLWPYNTNIEGYIPISEKVAKLSSSTTQSMMVFLKEPTPTDIQDFETFAQDSYQEQNRPIDAGVSDFGFGIWKPDKTKEPRHEDKRLQDLTGEVSFSRMSLASQRVSFGRIGLLMLNSICLSLSLSHSLCLVVRKTNHFLLSVLICSLESCI